MELPELRNAARQIFDKALLSVDAHAAVGGAVRREGSRLTVVDTDLNLGVYDSGVFGVAIGKAAAPMAIALEDLVGDRLTAGMIAGPVSVQADARALAFPPGKFSTA